MIQTLAIALLCTLAMLSSPLSAARGAGETALPTHNRTLLVGTKETPPFAMKNQDGHWTGISIDLWRQIAEELKLSYEWRELDQAGLLAGIKDGSLDAVAANLTITPERLNAFDFTYPFFTTGLGIAVARQNERPVLSILYQLFTWTMLKIALGVMLLVFLVGIVFWLLERKKNKEQFGGPPAQGIASGFWLSAVTMTTVGYGDKHPKTAGGRLAALIWMFLSIILVSLFTAAITSHLTVKQLTPGIRGLEDIKKLTVGTLPKTTSETFLQQQNIAFRTYPSVVAGLEALERGEIKALVYDIPALRYWINLQFSGRLEVLPQSYSQENYGIALTENFPLRKMINQVLLEKIREQHWQELLYHYLGG